MRIPRVRFTIARMMVAVAVIALLLGAVAILRRRANLQGLADYHAETARQIRSLHVWTFRPDGPPVDISFEDPRLADYHEDMAGKYKRAACYPWLPVAPDPPKPK
jgi:hypothetical protein